MATNQGYQRRVGNSNTNHKYIRKEWVNGRWVYYYKDKETTHRGNVGLRGGSTGSYTAKDGSKLNVKNTDKLIGGKRTNTVNDGGKKRQVTTIEIGKGERAVRKAANVTKSKAKKAAKKIKTETENERTLIKEGISAIKKQTAKKAKSNKTLKKAKKSISKTLNKAEKSINKTVKKAKKTATKNKKKAKKGVNKLIKNIGGNDLKKAIKKYKKSLSK